MIVGLHEAAARPAPGHHLGTATSSPHPAPLLRLISLSVCVCLCIMCVCLSVCVQVCVCMCVYIDRACVDPPISCMRVSDRDVLLQVGSSPGTRQPVTNSARANLFVMN